MSKLVTRKPTGKAPWPMVLIEGSEKSGKSWAWASFTASPRIGRVVVCIVGETDGDAYAAIPGANYELINHDGSYRSILSQLQYASDELAEIDGKPPMLVLDNISSLWSQITDDAQATANDRAARRNKGRAPVDDVQITMDLWNQCANRWRAVMEAMMRFRGIVIVVGRGKEVAAMDSSGKPTTAKDYKVEGHKTLTFDVDVWVRALGISRNNTWDGQLMGARSVKVGVSPTMNRTLKDWSLEHVIFDLLSAGENLSPERSFTPAREDIEEAAPKQNTKKASTKPAPKTQSEFIDHSNDNEWKYELNALNGLLEGYIDQTVVADFKAALSRKFGMPHIKFIPAKNMRDCQHHLAANDDLDLRYKRLQNIIDKHPAQVTDF